MNRLSNILTLALAFQLLLVVAVFWPRGTEGEDDARTPLLSLAKDGIDRIAISDAESSVLLTRDGDAWQLPEYHGLPVDGQKLRRVTENLPTLARGWPVASSSSAKERFEVAEENFQRKVAYFTGENSEGGLYLGTSPGFRKVHTRIDGGDPVYAVEFNTFDLPVAPAEWLDKTLLQLKDVNSVTGLDYSIRKDGEAWTGEGEQAPAQAEVDKLVNGLTSMRVTAAADIATASILAEMAAPPTLTVGTNDGSHEIRLYETEDTYYIQRADIPVFFSLSQFDYDRLNEVNAASLYPVEEEVAAEADTPEA